MSKVQYKDLREWLKVVEDTGELRCVEGATWQEDIGMATELLNHTPQAPAALFDSIPGYPKGFRVLTNALLSNNRLAITFGLKKGLSKFDLSTELYKRTEGQKPLPPVYVESGPIMENVLEGEAVDVLKFPTPKWHEEDGADTSARAVTTSRGTLTRAGLT